MAPVKGKGHTCANHVTLKPEEASWLDLLRFLLFSGTKKRFIDSPDENEKLRKRDFSRRWFIVLSIALQKILLAVKDVLKQVGDFIEEGLNLISNNGGLLMLLFNFLIVKVIATDTSSARYRSVIGNLDTRIDLDKNIKPSDKSKYYGLVSIMAAKLAYENKAFAESVVNDHWKMKFLGFHNFWNVFQNRPSTPVIMLQDKTDDPDLIVVAFRGTHPFDAYGWQTDVDLSYLDIEGIGKVHCGFSKALGLQAQPNNYWGWPKGTKSGDNKEYAYYEITKMLKNLLKKHDNAQFIVTGHSLGGALAILYVSVLIFHEEEELLDRLQGVYTYGQPRVGNGQFGAYMEENLDKYNVNYRRYVYCNDLVPRIPAEDKSLSYVHFGQCLYFNSLYHGQVQWEEPNKNYFSVWSIIPNYLNAVWELIRGFLIQIWNGSDYKESWVMKLTRAGGLLIPGLSAHCPQDYVNSTCLGSLPPNFDLQTKPVR